MVGEYVKGKRFLFLHASVLTFYVLYLKVDLTHLKEASS